MTAAMLALAFLTTALTVALLDLPALCLVPSTGHRAQPNPLSGALVCARCHRHLTAATLLGANETWQGQWFSWPEARCLSVSPDRDTPATIRPGYLPWETR